jgi:hypothetical protein
MGLTANEFTFMPGPHDPRDDYDDEPSRGRTTPDRLVYWAGTAIWSLGLAQLATLRIGVYFELMRLWERLDGGPPIQEVEAEEFAAIFVLLAICSLLVAAVIFGAARMRRFRNYGWAVAAAALNVFSIPLVPLALLTIPVSIWALVLLARADVRNRFEASRRASDGARKAGP